MSISFLYSEEALKIPDERREAKGKGENERYTYLDAEFQRIARRDKKAFLSDQCRKIEEINRMGKTRDLFKNIRDTRGTFHIKMGTVKNMQLTYDLSQVPYDYAVKVTNRFKGLDLVDRVLEKLWTEIGNTVQEILTKPPSQKERQSSCLRRP